MSVLGNFRNNLTAAGADQANALLIPVGQTYSRITTSTTDNNGVRLPTGTTNGMLFCIRNDAAEAADSQLNIYPPTGGQLNALGANVAFVLARGQSLQCVGDGAGNFLCFGAKYAGRLINAATTLTVSEDGATYNLTQTAGVAYTITLPSPVGCAGCTYTFVLVTPNGAADSNILIRPVETNLMRCNVLAAPNGAPGNTKMLVDATGIRYQVGELAGGRVTTTSDGVRWNSTGISMLAAGAGFIVI